MRRIELGQRFARAMLKLVNVASGRQDAAGDKERCK